MWRQQWLSCINIHQYFWFKFFFFFSYQPISFFRPKHTNILPIWSESARFSENLEKKKKKNPQTRHRCTGICVGLRCGTLPTASVLPRWDCGWRPTGCITYHSKKKKKKVCECVQCVYSFQVTMKLSTRTTTCQNEP